MEEIVKAGSGWVEKASTVLRVWNHGIQSKWMSTNSHTNFPVRFKPVFTLSVVLHRKSDVPVERLDQRGDLHDEYSHGTFRSACPSEPEVTEFSSVDLQIVPLFPEALVVKHPITNMIGHVASRMRVFRKDISNFKWYRSRSLIQLLAMGPHVSQTLQAPRTAKSRVRMRRATSTELT